MHHVDEGNGPLITVLKSIDYDQSTGSAGELPYRIDLLRDSGFRLGWTDENFRISGMAKVALDRVEQAFVPFSQAALTSRLRASSVATIAMFESEGHATAVARALRGRRPPPLIVVSCWLAHLLRTDTSGRRGLLYRRLYRGVDAVTVFSENQRATLVDLAAIPPERIHVIRFGIDLDELKRLHVDDTGSVVAAGRDLGRDWTTLAIAAAGTGWRVDLVTRPSQVTTVELPPEINMRGRISRSEYLRTLAGASVVVLPSEVREYPTGQTVLLEAMALGKACVVTDTPAMREYVDDGVNGLLVPPGDPSALRSTVEALLLDHSRRRSLGAEAARREARHGGARSMWSSVAGVVEEVRSTSYPTARGLK